MDGQRATALAAAKTRGYGAWTRMGAVGGGCTVWAAYAEKTCLPSFKEEEGAPVGGAAAHDQADIDGVVAAGHGRVFFPLHLGDTALAPGRRPIGPVLGA